MLHVLHATLFLVGRRVLSGDDAHYSIPTDDDDLLNSAWILYHGIDW